ITPASGRRGCSTSKARIVRLPGFAIPATAIRCWKSSAREREMPFTIKARVAGVDALVRSLQEFGRGVRNRVLRKALKKGARLIIQQARQLVPMQTGLLKKSLGVVMRTYKRSGAVVAIIGPREDFKTTATMGGRSFNIDPAYYAHLVERGRKA